MAEPQRLNRRTMLQAGGAGAAGAALTASIVAGPAAVQAGNPSIVGSWRAMLSLETPQGTQQDPALLTFFADGTCVQSNTPGTSTGHGIWQAAEPSHYLVRTESLGFGPGPAQDVRPSVIVTVDAQLHFDATGDQLDGPFQVAVQLLTGAAAGTSEGHLRAVPIRRL